MKSHLKMAAAGLLFLVTPAFAQTAHDLSAKDRQEYEAAAQKWADAYNAKNAAGVAAIYTDDAIYITPYGFSQGPAGVKKSIEDQFKAGGHDLVITIKYMRPAGDGIWAAGEWSVKYGDQPAHGYWSTTTVRDGNVLKITEQTFNMAAPPPPK